MEKEFGFDEKFSIFQKMGFIILYRHHEGYSRGGGLS